MVSAFRRVFLPVVPLLCVISGCAATSAGTSEMHDSAASSDSLRSIHVVRRGWHTGLAIAVEDWPNRDWALLADFPDADHLEFGWGDERFYQAERNTVWLGVRAALWPTSSVIHVIGLQEPVVADAQAAEVVRVRIRADQLRQIATAIEREFAGSRPVPTGNTLAAAPSPNKFYEAHRHFYFPRMCNWWIATRLRQADCPVLPWTVVTASRMMREARECAALYE